MVDAVGSAHFLSGWVILPSMAAYWIIFSFIALGLLLQKCPKVPARSAHWLNQTAIFVCLPALVLIHVPTLEPDRSLLPLVVLPWALLVVTILLVWPLGRWFGWSKEVRAVLLVLLPLGNTSFLGFPLVEALLGTSALPLAVVYDQFGSFLMVCTHVLFVVAWFGQGPNPTVGRMLSQMIRFPPFLALIVALVFGHDWLGPWGWGLAETLAASLLPIVTVAIGLSLKWRLPSQYYPALIFGVAAKLLGLPMVAVGLLALTSQLIPLDPMVGRVALLEAAMPSMITASALLIRAKLAPDLASAVVTWSVLLSITTVPLWHHIGGLIWG